MNLEKNVWDCLDRFSIDFGNFKKVTFKQNALIFLSEKTTSPIEQIYYFALLAYSELYGLNYMSVRNEFNSKELACFLYPQKEIGTYRVDFLFEHFDMDMNLIKVVVELDGHDFHDKDKKQRAYEKSRDRYLTRLGYKVLHFTGSELIKDPYKAVLETLVALTIADEIYLLRYNPNNPFGVV